MTAQLDPEEAPPGFYAVLKSAVAAPCLGNICRACDWRPECDGFAHRCMSYSVICSSSGRELKRQDGCGVVFKRKPPNGCSKPKPTARNPDDKRAEAARRGVSA